ncbi:probable peptidyl-tRNA hydrolase 2 [Centruroides sculpturatus]|uniref:probable peptidyl-tRNA hydrolase 2 n=1 Tax=Centruroides sculpturatus TaxID=218467 RepID=UPI000C6D7806|nr:probable peptidyl-tRNA hydrolase 2 [Centruroides sculpturatus]XP_023227176.1 probable peptidyl-tRNA hydrolase 2 [Centruroides sculpturatus]
MNEQREAGDGEESPPNPSSQHWHPNEEYMKVLIGMGVSRNAAEKALFYTGNKSPDLAAAWIFENQDMDLETPLEAEAGHISDNDIETADAYKMVFVVNMALEMGTGKIASQVAHAALGIHRLLLQDENKYGDMVLQWEELGEIKIVLRGDSTQHLVELERLAMSMNLPTYLVQDAGRTQVPEGSTTVLSILGRIDLVDRVTGALRLL